MAKTTANLDHLRWIAASAVVVSHARGFVMADYSPAAGKLAKLVYFVTGFSHQAVVIFFVLSGYLVGGAALRLIGQSSPADHYRFVIDRFARIFTVLWPALALVALIAALAPLTPVVISGTWADNVPDLHRMTTPASWLGTGVLLNEIVTTTIPYDSPLWSLAFEWTYYVLACAAIFLAARDRRPAAVALLLYALLLLVLTMLHSWFLLEMGLLWVIGAAATKVRPFRAPWLTIPAMLAGLVFSRFQLVPPLASDLVVGLVTAGLIADKAFQQRSAFERGGAYLASFSFSLYAIHFPVIVGTLALAQSRGYLPQRLPAGPPAYALIAGLVALAFIAAWLFAVLTEHRTHRVRRTLYRLANVSRPPRPA